MVGNVNRRRLTLRAREIHMIPRPHSFGRARGSGPRDRSIQPVEVNERIGYLFRDDVRTFLKFRPLLGLPDATFFARMPGNRLPTSQGDGFLE